MQKKRIRSYLGAGLMSLCLGSSLQAAGIGGIPTPEAPSYQETMTWREEVLSLLKKIELHLHEMKAKDEERAKRYSQGKD